MRGTGASTRSLRFQIQHGEKSFLRNIDLADALHAALSFFLLFQQLALARDVTAVALCDNVLADGRNILAGDDPASDRGLDGYFEHLSRDELPHLLDECF